MQKLLIPAVLLAFLYGCDATVETPPQATHFTSAQLETAAQLRDTALAGSGAYELLDSLVTTAPNRLAGGPDDPKAVEWAKNTFTALGFDKVWTQPVTLPGWRRISASASVIGPDGPEFNIVSLGKSASTPPGGVTAPVAHFDTYETLEAADPSEVAGRIVFISNRMASDGSPGAYEKAVIARAKGHLAVAEKNGLALLIRSIGTDDSDHPHTGAMSFGENQQEDVFEPATTDQAWAIQYGVKTVGSAALSNQDADLLQSIMESGDQVLMQVDIQNENLGMITTHNIIGEITGSSRPDEIVVTGGHIDAWDLGVGAMDDGMGVAITTSAVKLIAELPERPARTIRMVAFAAEEVGIHGGKAYAVEYGGLDHVFGSELDFGLGKARMLVPNVADTAVPVMEEIWTLLEPMGIQWFTGMPGYVGADLSPMAEKGLRGAMVAVDWTRYFDYHHTAADTMDLIEPDDLDFNVAAYAVMLYLAAEYEGRFD